MPNFIYILLAIVGFGIVILGGIIALEQDTMADGAMPPPVGRVLGSGGLVVDGHGPLWSALLGPIEVIYVECHEIPCMIRVEDQGDWSYIIVSEGAPRG